MNEVRFNASEKSEFRQDKGEEPFEKKKHKRRLMSKYDSVKVYVWLSGESRHSYVMSRYLIARMLTVAKVPYVKSARIALNLKKRLVDSGQLDISQDELETYLFDQMQMKGFGDDYFRRLKFVNRFFSVKRPLIITICGAPLTGKSTLAQQLAAKCNLPHVLQTDLIYEMLRQRKNSPLSCQSFLSRSDLVGRDFTAEYERECLIMRQSLEAEIQKTLHEGKCLIMEGIHLDPGLYLSEWFPSMITSLDTNCPSNLLYIPIVVAADHDEHRILVREALCTTSCRFLDLNSTLPGLVKDASCYHIIVIVDKEEVFDRFRKLQDFLMEYQNKKIVHVKIGLSGMERALEMLHNIFLSCIEMS